MIPAEVRAAMEYINRWTRRNPEWTTICVHIAAQDAEIARRHGIGGELIIARRERDDAIAERDVLRARIDGAAYGKVVLCGTDENDQPRVLVHCSVESLSRGPSIAFKRVALVSGE